MTKLKSAVDYLQEIQDDGVRLLSAQVQFILINKIKDIQQNAIEAALEVAAKETTKFEYNTPIISPTTLQNKRKILSLINHKDLKL